MKKGPKHLYGYSRLEIAFMLVLALLVVTLAVTKYIEISKDVEGAMEPGLIEGIRKGLVEYAEEAKSRGEKKLYPPVLDYAKTGDASQRNLFFDRVLAKGVAVAGWSKTNVNEYRTPSGKMMVYDPETGRFTSISDRDNGAPQTTSGSDK